MLNCPNKSSNEWKHLVEILGETTAYKVFLANNEEVPDFNTIEILTNSIIKEQRIDNFDEILNKYKQEFDKAKTYLNIDDVKEYTEEQFINRLSLLKKYNNSLDSSLNIKFKLSRYNGSLPNLYKIRIDDVHDRYQKTSNNPEITKDNAAFILNKLKNKFNINWEFNTNIEQAGLYNPILNIIYINPDLMYSDTPFHEFLHPFIILLKDQNINLYNKLIKEVENTEIHYRVKELYPELTNGQQLEEALVQTIGIEASKEQLKKPIRTNFKIFLNWISIKLRQLFGKSELKGLQYSTTINELSVLFNDPFISIDLSKNKDTIIKEQRVSQITKQQDIIDKILFESNKLILNEDTHTYVDKETGTAYKAVSKAMYDIPGYGTVVNSDEENEVLDRAARAGSVIHMEASNYFTNKNDESFKEQGLDDSDKVKITDEAKKDFINTILSNSKFKGKNIKILSEIIVADKENGIAGTVDLIVIDEKGRVYIYDFKTSESGKVFKFYKKGFSPKNQKSTESKHNLQLSIYSNILKQYGIITDTKGIIKVRYSMSGNNITKIWPERENSESGTGFDNMADDNEDYKKILYYRNSIENQEDERLASLKKQAIRTLEENVKQLEKVNKLEAADKLNQIAQDLFELNNDTAIAHFISQAGKLIELTKNRLQSDLVNKTLTLSKLKEYTSYATGFDLLEELHDWAIESDKQDIAQLVNQFIGDKNYIKNAYETYGSKILIQTLKPEFNAIKTKYRNEAIIKYNTLSESEKQSISKEEFIKQSLDKLEDQIDLESEEILEQELKKASSDISKLGRWIFTMGSTKDPIIGPLMRIITRKINTANINSRKVLETTLSVVEKLEKQQSNSMFTKMEDFYDFMLEKDSNGKYTQNIVIQYNEEFRSLYYTFISELNDELNDLSNKYTFEKRKELRMQKTKEFWDKYAPIKNKREYAIDIKNSIQELLDTNQITKDEFTIISNNRKKDFTTYLSAETSELLSNTLSSITKKHRVLKTEYVDKQWLKLEELRKTNPEDPKVLMYNQIVEMIRSGNAKLPVHERLGGYFQNKLPGILKDNYDQLKSNGVLDTIKHNLKNAVSVREDDVTRGYGAIDKTTSKQLKKLPVYFTNSISEKDQNYDLATIVFKFYKMAEEYQQKSEILPEIELAKLMLDKRLLKSTDKKGNPIFSVFSKNSRLGSEQAVNGYASNIAEQFSDFIDAIFYGQKEKEQGSFTIPIVGKEVDIAKLGQTLQNYISLNLLGLNYVQAVNNVLVGETNQLVEALASDYITLKSYRKGAKMYDKEFISILNDVGTRKPTSMTNLLLNHFNIDSEDLEITFKNNSKLQEVAKTSTVYWTMKSGEHFMKGRFLLGMLHEKIVHDKDGKILGPAINFFYKDENGSLKFDKEGIVNDFTLNDQLNFGAKINEINTYMHGAYGEMNWVALQQGMFGRMALAYRRWIVPGLRRRYSKNGYNYLLDEYREGYYITAGKFFTKLFKDLRIIQTVAWTEDWNNLTDHQKANMKRFSVEFGVMISLLFIASAMKDLGDDNKDDEWIAYWNYQASRMKTDMWFYSNPWESIKLLKSPMAAVSTIESIGKLVHQGVTDPFAVYVKGSEKGNNKFIKDFYDLVPVYRQLYRNIIDETSWLNK